jgi:hypothetical protein
VTKQIEQNAGIDVSLVWSLDGGTISTIFHHLGSEIWTVHTCNISSGVTLSSITLQSTDNPHLWAHDRSFQVMITGRDGQAIIIEIFEVGSVLTKLKSFLINLPTHWDTGCQIISFSPITYHISIQCGGHFAILEIWSSKYLLEKKGSIMSSCFSFDGSLFAARIQSNGYIQTWKYLCGLYTISRGFEPQGAHNHNHTSLHFSPTLSSILGSLSNSCILWVWCLDLSLTITQPSNFRTFATPHCCATYMATYRPWSTAIATTNLLSQIPPQFIDTDMQIEKVAITGNVLLVFGLRVIAAWRLTEEGVVDGVFGNKRAGFCDRIWTIPRYSGLTVCFEDQIGFIKEKGTVVTVYHTETGEELDPTQVTSPNPEFHSWYDMDQGWNHTGCHQPNEDDQLDMETAMQQGWVKGPEGKYQLWLPVKWRPDPVKCIWLHTITTLCFTTEKESVVVKF